MAPQAPPPALRGLRLGFADLAPAARALESILELAVVPSASTGLTTPPAPPVYALDGLRLEALTVPARPGADLQRPLRLDALLWQHPDIAGRRQHLRRLGLCALDDADLACPDRLRLETIDTGACALEWQADASPPPALPVSLLGLVAIELRVRAPERTAGHWAALLDAPLRRDRSGTPLLHAAPAALRFVPAPESSGAGIAALVFAAPQARRLAQRAAAQGLAVAADASWAAGGLRICAAQPD